MYYTNNGAALTGALSTININGSVYQLGKDASTTEGGIMKLFSDYAGNGSAQDGTYTAKAVYDQIEVIKTALGIEDGKAPVQDQIDDINDKIGGEYSSENTVSDAIAAAKTTVAKAAGESYLTVAETAGADGHAIYTLGTTGIDNAISSAIASVVNGAPDTFDTLKEIADWIATDETGTADLVADIAGKAEKVSNAVAGNFAGLDANGNLTDSGSKASDFKTIQAAVASPSASGNAAAFIDSISQNANGVITVTKKNVQAASATQAGLMSANDYNKLAAISASVNNDTLTIVTVAA